MTYSYASLDMLGPEQIELRFLALWPTECPFRWIFNLPEQPTYARGCKIRTCLVRQVCYKFWKYAWIDRCMTWHLAFIWLLCDCNETPEQVNHIGMVKTRLLIAPVWFAEWNAALVSCSLLFKKQCSACSEGRLLDLLLFSVSHSLPTSAQICNNIVDLTSCFCMHTHAHAPCKSVLHMHLLRKHRSHHPWYLASRLHPRARGF